MLSFGAVKLRCYRKRGADCPAPGRLSQGALGDQLGVSAAFVSQLEGGTKLPGLALATRLEAMGVCAAADWSRPAKCAACGVALDGEPECPRGDCPHPELVVAPVEDAA